LRVITILSDAGARASAEAPVGRVFVVQILSTSWSGTPISEASCASLPASSPRTNCGSTPRTTTERLVARSAPWSSTMSPRRALSEISWRRASFTERRRSSRSIT
jgi:hypothetical protein